MLMSVVVFVLSWCTCVWCPPVGVKDSVPHLVTSGYAHVTKEEASSLLAAPSAASACPEMDKGILGGDYWIAQLVTLGVLFLASFFAGWFLALCTRKANLKATVQATVQAHKETTLWDEQRKRDRAERKLIQTQGLGSCSKPGSRSVYI